MYVFACERLAASLYGLFQQLLKRRIQLYCRSNLSQPDREWLRTGSSEEDEHSRKT